MLHVLLEALVVRCALHRYFHPTACVDVPKCISCQLPRLTHQLPPTRLFPVCPGLPSAPVPDNAQVW